MYLMVNHKILDINQNIKSQNAYIHQIYLWVLLIISSCTNGRIISIAGFCTTRHRASPTIYHSWYCYQRGIFYMITPAQPYYEFHDHGTTELRLSGPTYDGVTTIRTEIGPTYDGVTTELRPHYDFWGRRPTTTVLSMFKTIVGATRPCRTHYELLGAYYDFTTILPRPSRASRPPGRSTVVARSWLCVRGAL